MAIKVDVWSDVACPWCYIGKRRFEAGRDAFLAADPAREVEVEYHSFELSPDTPVDFEGSEIEFLSAYKGMTAQQVEPMLARVTGIAETVGLKYDFDKLQHTNTVKAHELLHYAKAHGRQLEMTERLLSAYFVEGRHVGHVDDLADLASEVGLDREDVIRSLTSDEYLDAVHADQRQARAYGINGVPFYVIDAKYGVSGAQESDAFAQVLTTRWDELGAS
jgi:predicted DsbA family dithiol-disulfide isomerase